MQLLYNHLMIVGDQIQRKPVKLNHLQKATTGSAATLPSNSFFQPFQAHGSSFFKEYSMAHFAILRKYYLCRYITKIVFSSIYSFCTVNVVVQPINTKNTIL